MFAIMGNAKYKFFNIYLYFPGITIGFYATFLANLVKRAVPQDFGEVD